MISQEQIANLVALITEQTRVEYLKKGYTLELHGDNWKAHRHEGKKYTRVDVGSSGKYMVDNVTGEIFGIKAYGVIHRGHRYGTLDTISDYYWGDYVAFKLQAVVCESFCPLVNNGDYRGTICVRCGKTESEHQKQTA